MFLSASAPGNTKLIIAINPIVEILPVADSFMVYLSSCLHEWEYGVLPPCVAVGGVCVALICVRCGAVIVRQLNVPKSVIDDVINK